MFVRKFKIWAKAFLNYYHVFVQIKPVNPWTCGGEIFEKENCDNQVGAHLKAGLIFLFKDFFTTGLVLVINVKHVYEESHSKPFETFCLLLGKK